MFICQYCFIHLGDLGMTYIEFKLLLGYILKMLITLLCSDKMVTCNAIRSQLRYM